MPNNFQGGKPISCNATVWACEDKPDLNHGKDRSIRRMPIAEYLAGKL